MPRAASILFLAAFLAACDAGMMPGSPTPAAPTPGTGTPTPGADTPAPGGESVTVTVDNIAFETNSVTIAPGTEVVWVNEDAVGHTITHGEQGVPVDDPLFDEPHPVGESFSFTFAEAGTYPVTCTIHPQMNMTVTVE